MVQLHTARGGCALTESPGYGSGAPAPRYGEPGQLCAAGCGTVLRRTNPWDTCAACQAAGHPGEARPTVKRHEEAKVSTKAERQKAIIDYLERHDGWHSLDALATALDIPRGGMSGYLATLDVARRPRSAGGGFASLRWAESQKTAPDPRAAPAPAAHREQSAEVAAEVPPVPPPPAADIITDVRAHDRALTTEEVEASFLELNVAPDLELYVLQLLADLDPEARERVLQFAVAKWCLT